MFSSFNRGFFNYYYDDPEGGLYYIIRFGAEGTERSTVFQYLRRPGAKPSSEVAVACSSTSEPVDPDDSSTLTCQGCAFKDVELLRNSFLANFLPGGCATLPPEGLPFIPYEGAQTLIVSYSSFSPWRK